MYCLFVEKKLVTIKHFLLNFFGEGGGGGGRQNVWQNDNFFLYVEHSRKGPIFMASNES